MSHAPILAEWFGLDDAAAAFLDELYAAKGLTVLHEHLCCQLDCSIAALRARAFDLHAAMDPGSLVAVYGTGYRLSEIGIADCDRGLADAAQRGQAA